MDREHHCVMEGGRAKLEAWSHTLGPGKGGKKTGEIFVRHLSNDTVENFFGAHRHFL